MKRPHWQQWWGESKTEPGYIRDMVEGRDTTRPFILEPDGDPGGKNGEATLIMTLRTGNHRPGPGNRPLAFHDDMGSGHAHD